MSKIKIGRNDPCPCKSGIKYKKCCQSQEAANFSPQWEKREVERWNKWAADPSLNMGEAPQVIVDYGWKHGIEVLNAPKKEKLTNAQMTEIMGLATTCWPITLPKQPEWR